MPDQPPFDTPTTTNTTEPPEDDSQDAQADSSDDSQTEGDTKGTQDDDQDTEAQAAQIDTTTEVGDSTAGPSVGEGGTDPATRVAALVSQVTGRFMREKRWFGDEGLSKTRDDMLRLAKVQKMSKLDAQAWAYSELDRLYPPLETGDADSKNKDLRQEPSLVANDLRQKRKFSAVQEYSTDSGQIQGLGNIPQDWPELQSNASLSSEIGWVQANRLRVVEERPGAATLVQLERAGSPAPSWAALGWLETSIRSYAKFVDVAARASGGDDDEGAVMRRERMALDEVRGLLEEMREAEGGTVCRRCGHRIGSAPENEPDPPGGATESR